MEQEKYPTKDNASNAGNLQKLSIFEGDDYFLYIYKKAEKIAAAVYMISDFFSDSEPLKPKIRSAVLSLIDMSLSLNTTLSPDRKGLLNNLVREALSVISFSEVAARSGIESVMNHQILKSELDQFIRTIEERELPHKLGRHFILDESMIRDEIPVPASMPRDNNVKVAPPHITKQKVGHAVSVNHIAPQHAAADKTDRLEKSNRKSDRQEAIISVIKSRGESSIKDLTGVIKGCSEKTIQRELLLLVDKGILTRTGERRWSRYSLAN